MINSQNQVCFVWEKLLLIMAKSKHYLGFKPFTGKLLQPITGLPFSSRATLGSLWTGRIRSSAKLWQPHSGLAWFTWGKEEKGIFLVLCCFFGFVVVVVVELHKILSITGEKKAFLETSIAVQAWEPFTIVSHEQIMLKTTICTVFIT